MSVFTCQIETQRLLLRPLEITDVGDVYLSWFEHPEVSRFISVAATRPSLEDLKSFISVRRTRWDVLFLGIFLRDGGEHIGNIKFEPLDESEGYAVMGILIGSPIWRGKGVAREVIEASNKWLVQHRNIRRIYLGVDRQNHSAIRAYEKIGFQENKNGDVLTSSSANLAMVLLLSPNLEKCP